MLLILAIILFLAIGLPGLLFAPWVPTKRRDFDRVNALMEIEPGMHIFDLGCGSGGVLFELAKRHPHATFEGIELSFVLYLICMVRKWINKNPNVRFRLGNLLTADISNADRIYLFGTPKGLTERLKAKFKKEAKPDTRIISYCFEITGWEPEQIAESKKTFLPVFRYKVPNK